MIPDRRPRLDAAEIAAAIRPESVLERYSVEYTRQGHEFRTRHCPVCGQRSRDAVCINAETGRWIDHAHGCHGDVLALLAGYAEIPIETEFPRVLEVAAELPGAPAPMPSTPMRTRPAPSIDYSAEWNNLERRSLGGERYLATQRRISPAELRARGVDVRYGFDGSVCLPLRDLATGAIVGIQRRRIDGGEPKVMSDRRSRVVGTYLGDRAPVLDPGGVDVAVIVEGLADALVANLCFPGCAIYGAPGAGQIPTIMAHVAPLVAAVNGWIVLVPDDDDPGVEACAAALLVARHHGLDDNRGVYLADLGGHHDLAAAWAAGWRWRWPAEMTGDADGRSS